MESKSEVNNYVCQKNPQHVTITVNRNDGVTPFMVGCPQCESMAQSRMYRVPQDGIPTHEFVRLEGEELEAFLKVLFEESRKEKKVPLYLAFETWAKPMREWGPERLYFRKIGPATSLEVLSGQKLTPEQGLKEMDALIEELFVDMAVWDSDFEDGVEGLVEMCRQKKNVILAKVELNA